MVSFSCLESFEKKISIERLPNQIGLWSCLQGWGVGMGGLACGPVCGVGGDWPMGLSVGELPC